MKKLLISIGCFCCFFFIIGILGFMGIDMAFGHDKYILSFKGLNDSIQRNVLTALNFDFASNESILSICKIRYHNYDEEYKIEIQTDNINDFLNNNSFLPKFFQKTNCKMGETGYYYDKNILYIVIQTRDYSIMEQNTEVQYLSNLNNTLEELFDQYQNILSHALEKV